MVSIPGNKVKVAQIIVGKKFLAKRFFVIMGVYFENMAIRNCDYPAAIKPQKLIYSLITLPILLVFLEIQLK